MHEYLIEELLDKQDGSRELNCGCTFDICQGILKIEKLLHRQGLVKTQLLRTVSKLTIEIAVWKPKSLETKQTTTHELYL